MTHNWHDITNAQPADDESNWIIPHVIPARGKVILFGHGGIGKTRILYDLALAVTTKTLWAGLHRVNLKGPSLVIAGEGDLAMNLDRLRLSSAGHGVRDVAADAVEKDWLKLDGKPYLLDQPEDAKSFLGLIGGAKPMLTIIDPFDSFFSGDENSVKETKGFRRIVDEAIAEHQTTAIIVHHEAAGTDGSKKMIKPRGTTALIGWADTLIHVSSLKGGLLRVSIEKQRNGISKWYFDVRPIHNGSRGFLAFQGVSGPEGLPKQIEETEEKKNDPEAEKEIAAEAMEALGVSSEELHDLQHQDEDPELPDPEAIGRQNAVMAYLQACEDRAATKNELYEHVRGNWSHIVTAVDNLCGKQFVKFDQVKVDMGGGFYKKRLGVRLTDKPYVPEVFFDDYLPIPHKLKPLAKVIQFSDHASQNDDE